MKDRPWEGIAGPWGITRHAMERLTERFSLGEEDIAELRACLDKEAFVRVPENNPRPRRYVLQLSLSKGSIFLIVAEEAKIIVSARPPFCNFKAAIPGDPIPTTGWKDDDDYGLEENILAEFAIPARTPTIPRQPKGLPAGVTLIQVPMYRSAVGRLCNTAEEAAEVNIHYQVMKLVEDIGDSERDDDEKYLTHDDMIEFMISGGPRLVRIFAGEVVFPWPKEATK